MLLFKKNVHWHIKLWPDFYRFERMDALASSNPHFSNKSAWARMRPPVVSGLECASYEWIVEADPEARLLCCLEILASSQGRHNLLLLSSTVGNSPEIGSACSLSLSSFSEFLSVLSCTGVGVKWFIFWLPCWYNYAWNLRQLGERAYVYVCADAVQS